MSAGKPPRAPPTPSPTSAPSDRNSKLPKFLQKSNRDRSKSLIEPINSNDSGMASSSSSSSAPPAHASPPLSSSGKQRSDRRRSKIKSPKEPTSSPIEADSEQADESVEDTPVIIEPMLPTSRSRSRNDRPLSPSASDPQYLVLYNSSPSSQRISDMSTMSTRLSGWFQQAFSSSTTDLTIPTILANAAAMSAQPRSKSTGLGILNAARHGKGHIDKAVRYLLDSDSTPDKCTDPIWLLGVQHPGYEPPPLSLPTSSSPQSPGRRSSLDIRRSSSFRHSVSSMRGATSSPEPSMARQQSKNPGDHWPPAFYNDFSSRIWLTYRSHYPPIRDITLHQLENEANGQAPSTTSASPRRWNWPGTGERGWTSDSGWGCMLRTGQSLLATTLIHLHLGRDWRRPPNPLYTADYATYVKVLTWFFDSPDPSCPFSVHRMALAGKDLGKDVGSWFGPSTAAGAIKALVHAFPEAGLGVSVATDGVVYETDVLAASNVGPYMFRHSCMTNSSPSTKRRRSAQPQSMMSFWGQRPVLVLVGIRLGIDGVNPIYYDAVKALYTFPQSVGIAGGRPSSSYYFVGAQADSLFYLDPHHTRPAVPFRPPPSSHSPTDSPPSSYREPQIMPGHMQASSSISSYSSGMSASSSQTSGRSLSIRELDQIQEHYITSYTPQELRTFHCDKVRKMPLSGLDPSMLIGFLCRDARDWRDLRERVHEMSAKYKAIFSIQDEPPSWPSDSDELGMESVSDVEIDFEGPSDDFAQPPEAEGDKLREAGPKKDVEKKDNSLPIDERRGSEEVTTEEDVADPITPEPSSHEQNFEQAQKIKQEDSFKSLDSEHDLLGDDDDWVDPAVSTPQPGVPQQYPVIPLATADSTATTASYVSASSSYSHLEYMDSSGDAQIMDDREQMQKWELNQDNNENKEEEVTRRPSDSPRKTKSSRSGGGMSKRRSSSVQQTQYFPFPVVDDRDPEDADFTEVSSHSDSTPGEWHLRERTDTDASRTPHASRVTSSVSHNGNGNVGGSRIRNVFARDGGRTQSGGVRGIIAADLDDGSDF